MRLSSADQAKPDEDAMPKLVVSWKVAASYCATATSSAVSVPVSAGWQADRSPASTRLEPVIRYFMVFPSKSLWGA